MPIRSVRSILALRPVRSRRHRVCGWAIPEEIEPLFSSTQAINAEAAGGAGRIDRAAQARGFRARVAVLVIPTSTRDSPHISTGLHQHFGVPLEMASNRTAGIGAQPVSASRITSILAPRYFSVDRTARRCDRRSGLRRSSAIRLSTRHIDVGMPRISDDGSRSPTAADRHAAAVLSIVKPSGLAIALEPGRYLVGGAGALLARVIDLKDAPGGHHFAVLDAGMTELMRPALYGSFHRIEPVVPRHARELCYDIVGPVCESTDAFAHDRRLSPLEVATCSPSSCGSLRVGHGLELQPPLATGRGSGRPRRSQTHPAPTKH